MSELTVVALEAETLGSPVTALAMSPDGRRCYLGAGNSGHLREQLGVVDIGEDGRPVGLPRWYRITEEALTIGDNSAVRQILPHPSGSKLYLIFTHFQVQAQQPLVVFDLVDGEPTGAPRTYPSGLFAGRITALALHPDPGIGVLYGVTRSQRGVGMYQLNNDLEPDTPVKIATFGCYSWCRPMTSGGPRTGPTPSSSSVTMRSSSWRRPGQLQCPRIGCRRSSRSLVSPSSVVRVTASSSTPRSRRCGHWG